LCTSEDDSKLRENRLLKYIEDCFVTLVMSKGRVKKFDDISQTIGISLGTILGISSNSIP
jgi:hypothetical protein